MKPVSGRSRNHPPLRNPGISITNSPSKTVTIDSTTSSLFSNTLTISNLLIAASSGVTNTLYLNNTGSITVHILDGLSVGDDEPFDEDSTASILISTNSALLIDGVLGDPFNINDGSVTILGGSLTVTNSPLLIGASDEAVASLTISNATTQLQEIVAGNAGTTTANIQLLGGITTVNSSLTLGSNDVSSGNLTLTCGGLLVVTNAPIFIGGGESSNGSLILSNATALAADISIGSGFRCFGALAIDAGTVTLGGSLDLGSESSVGNVFLNGGLLVITNGETIVGDEQGNAAIIVQNGLFLAREIRVGNTSHSDGKLVINGGTVQLSSYLAVGFGSESTARVFVNGGQLVVTNNLIGIGNYACCDPACINVAGGLLAANYILVGLGVPSFAAGTIAVDNGTLTASTGITLGACAIGNSGFLTVGGGQVIVTNATSSGFVDVRDGMLTLTNGTLQVDNLVMTNTCSQFVHTGGTLLASNVILDPNAFRILSVTPQSNDVLIT